MRPSGLRIPLSLLDELVAGVTMDLDRGDNGGAGYLRNLR